MESFDSHTFSVLVLGGGLGLLLAVVAERYKLLERRNEGRCPACGVLRRRSRCACTER
ncbi:MAG TPA: hypothetical protein VK915_03055 [Gaiellaceae bacterium]|nr:hypothetical protein [Gaiellaceae bacterium]